MKHEYETLSWPEKNKRKTMHYVGQGKAMYHFLGKFHQKGKLDRHTKLEKFIYSIIWH